MKKQPIYKYYWFGTCERYLQDAHKDMSMSQESGVPYNIKCFLRNLNDLGLIVTLRVAEPRLRPLLKELEGVAVLEDEQAIRLRKAMDEIRTTLDAEIEDITAFTPTPKRLDLNKLLDDVGGLFGPDVFDSLPDIARYDFMEAGKCMAFERSTATAFHILRATESVLRFYYEQMVRRNRISSRMWGPIVNDLRKHALTKKFDILNNHLDNIRNSFRNPTQHPEATYDIHEVQDLWAVCVDVVNRMIRVLLESNRLV